MLHPPTRLADNRKPSEAEWNEARLLGQDIIRAVDERQAIIDKRNLDARFCLPDANWTPGPHNQYVDGYTLIRSLEWDQVRLLRFRCQSFNGFSILDNRTTNRTMRVTRQIPDDPLLPPEPPGTTLVHWGKLTDHLPRSRIFRPPCALGEIGWLVDGAIVSYEIIVQQERVTLLHETGVLDWLAGLGRPPRILEIGAGYGALAQALMSCLPNCEYTICDLPESMLFSGLYLSLAGQRRAAVLEPGTRPASGSVQFVPNYLFGDLIEAGRQFDLAINVLSMSEMSDYQIGTYGHGLRTLLGTDGIFFEQNHNNRHIGMTHAPDVLDGIMPYRRDIDPLDVPLTQGPPRLWSNSPIELVSGSRKAITN